MVVKSGREAIAPEIVASEPEFPDIGFPRRAVSVSGNSLPVAVAGHRLMAHPQESAVAKPHADVRELAPPAPPAAPQKPAAEAENGGLASNLSASVGDAAAFGVMVGVGETFIPAFTLALGMGDVFAGLIATIPLLIGSVLQLVSPWAVQWLGSHRRWVISCAFVQSLCFAPLVVAALMGRLSPLVAVVISSVYWGAGLATGPAWNTWQGTILPRSIRANFLAKRAKLQQIATLAGFLLGGFSLQAAGHLGNAVPMFAGLFCVAMVCRLLSTTCLWLQTEPIPLPAGQNRFTIRAAFRQASTGSTGALLLLAVSMQAGVYVSGPFFNPYMLKVLNFSYAGYAVLLGVSFVAKFVCLPLWGRYAHKHGAQSLLWVGAFGLVPLAGGWVVSSNFWYLLALQVVAGAAWAAYELALMLLFLETIPERERTNVLTLYNLVNSCALVFGSTLGAAVLKWGNISPEAYLWVFGLSTCVRLGSLVWLWRLPRMSGTLAETTVRPLTLRPSSGSIDDPVVAS